MTLPARSYPLSLPDALTELRDALGANYGAETDDATLTRALNRDAVTVDGAVHPRPWATAKRLIEFNTEYEVSKGLQARIDRKLKALDDQQREADLAAGIEGLVPNPAADDAQRLLALYGSGVHDNEAVL